MDFDISSHIVIYAEKHPDLNTYIKYLLTLIYHDETIVYTKNAESWEGFDVRSTKNFVSDMFGKNKSIHSCIIIDFSPETENCLKEYKLIYKCGHHMGIRLINIGRDNNICPLAIKKSPYSLYMFPKDKNIVAINSRRGSHHTINVPQC